MQASSQAAAQSKMTHVPRPPIPMRDEDIPLVDTHGLSSPPVWKGGKSYRGNGDPLPATPANTPVTSKFARHVPKADDDATVEKVAENLTKLGR